MNGKRQINCIFKCHHKFYIKHTLICVPACVNGIFKHAHTPRPPPIAYSIGSAKSITYYNMNVVNYILKYKLYKLIQCSIVNKLHKSHIIKC